MTASSMLATAQSATQSIIRAAQDLPGRTPARPTPHSQGGQDESGQEHGDANDQQVQQALRGNAHDPQRDRGYHQQQEESDHPSSIRPVAQRRASSRSPLA